VVYFVIVQIKYKFQQTSGLCDIFACSMV